VQSLSKSPWFWPAVFRYAGLGAAIGVVVLVVLAVGSEIYGKGAFDPSRIVRPVVGVFLVALIFGLLPAFTASLSLCLIMLAVPVMRSRRVLRVPAASVLGLCAVMVLLSTVIGVGSGNAVDAKFLANMLPLGSIGAFSGAIASIFAPERRSHDAL
jgi:hypothetical protein